MQKILEKILEPSVIKTGSFFTLKIKVRRGITYGELKQMTYNDVQNYLYSELKGD